MTDMLHTGRAWLTTQLTAYAATSVTYYRGADSVVLSAVAGGTRTTAPDANGNIVEIESQEYLIAAADLVLSGEQITPADGDRIVTDTGGVFRVCPLGSAGCWEYTDAGQSRLRVHTRRIGAE